METTIVSVYIPTTESVWGRTIKEGSGIVGIEGPSEARRVPPGMVLVYYEGNIYESQSYKTYADKVFHAADRMLWKGRGYPTVAMSVVDRDELMLVGSFEHPYGREIHVSDSEPLSAWIGHELDYPTDPDLQRSDRP